MTFYMKIWIIILMGLDQSLLRKKLLSQFLECLTGSDIWKRLKIRALIKDALYYRFITTKAGGWIEPIDSGIRLGKTPSECLEFSKEP